MECAFTGESMRHQVKTLTAHLVMSTIRIDLLGTLTFPAEFGARRGEWAPAGGGLLRRPRQALLQPGDERRMQATEVFLARWFRHGRYWTAYERHQSGLLHAHFVAEDLPPPGVRRLSLMDAWGVEVGGWARCEPVRSTEQVSEYVAKYICKQEQGELWPGPGVGGFSGPASKRGG